MLEHENEQRRYRNPSEARDANPELSKEQGDEEFEKKMAAKERAEQVARETKTAKKQMQNIMANMQTVVSAVAAIRQQLGLAGQGGSIPSVQQDERAFTQLKKKLEKLRGELAGLRQALLTEKLTEIKKLHPNWEEAAIRAVAADEVTAMLHQLGLQETEDGN